MKNKMRALGIIALIAVIVLSTAACSKKNSDGESSGKSVKSTEKKDNFNKYPADYQIAYVATYGSMFGLPKTLSVIDLFGPNAYFATSFNGVPSVVTLESTQGSQESFTAQLLVSVKASEGTGKEDMKALRMQITFESDSISEKSYMRYVKITDMVSGKTTEKKAYGDELSDAGVLAYFAGFWSQGLIWDISKYKQ